MGPVVFSFHLGNDSLKSLFKPARLTLPVLCTARGWRLEAAPKPLAERTETEPKSWGLRGLQEGVLQRAASLGELCVIPRDLGPTVAVRKAEGQRLSKPQVLLSGHFCGLFQTTAQERSHSRVQESPHARQPVGWPSCKLSLTALNFSSSNNKLFLTVWKSSEVGYSRDRTVAGGFGWGKPISWSLLHMDTSWCSVLTVSLFPRNVPCAYPTDLVALPPWASPFCSLNTPRCKGGRGAVKEI